ncbi:glycoside hydrolase family 88/105 protein [Granulicella arctica]|uniref:glycoside hydrolase family 88/105 protein n=1 Tax=Granulicella arctica TaxID=940613 RepID=UPI0021E06D92|nr:glycoside hydrolase family 88 protein [Granulicella arctica]
MNRIVMQTILSAALLTASSSTTFCQMTANESKASVGDAPADPGPLATDLSGSVRPAAVYAGMRKVADWQTARIAGSPSQDWTFATLYVGLLAASDTLHDPKYRDAVAKVAEHYHWTLGPRKLHADDQAIGQSYLWLYREKPDSQRIQPLRSQFDEVMKVPDDPAHPIWWWCDALFMAPPVWSDLAKTSNDPRYLEYMHREWKITSDLLWDPQEHLFYRDNSYFNKREKNGRKVFWSRGNGWVMGGIARMLETLPANDPHRAFYIDRLREMADSVAKLQGADGLWRPGLLDADDYPYAEVSGSAFFVYAMAYGVNHHLLDAKKFTPIVQQGWAGLVSHIYADGRLGSIQPVGAAPGAYTQGASYVFGTGAFLLAGSEVSRLATK